MKIQTDIESSGNINDGEITVFKQFDPLVKRFAIEKLEIETLSGEVQLGRFPQFLQFAMGVELLIKLLKQILVILEERYLSETIVRYQTSS